MVYTACQKNAFVSFNLIFLLKKDELFLLRLLVEVGLDVELGEEAEEDEHEDAGDQGELPRVAALRDAEDDDHALEKHDGELKNEKLECFYWFVIVK